MYCRSSKAFVAARHSRYLNLLHTQKNAAVYYYKSCFFFHLVLLLFFRRQASSETLVFIILLCQKWTSWAYLLCAGWVTGTPFHFAVFIFLLFFFWGRLTGTLNPKAIRNRDAKDSGKNMSFVLFFRKGTVAMTPTGHWERLTTSAKMSRGNY